MQRGGCVLLTLMTVMMTTTSTVTVVMMMAMMMMMVMVMLMMMMMMMIVPRVQTETKPASPNTMCIPIDSEKYARRNLEESLLKNLHKLILGK